MKNIAIKISTTADEELTLRISLGLRMKQLYDQNANI